MRNVALLLLLLLLPLDAKPSAQQKASAAERKEQRRVKQEMNSARAKSKRPEVVLPTSYSKEFINETCSDRAFMDGSSSVPRMLCAARGERAAPKIAVCLAGAARTFPHAIVKRSIKENLIDALGADVETFAYLKLADARGDERSSYNGKVNATRDMVLAAARSIGIPAAHVRTTLTSHVAPPACSAYPSWEDATMRRQGRYQVSYTHLYSAAYYQSFLGQLESRYQCMRLIEGFERKQQQPQEGGGGGEFEFDVVIIARPDLVWYRPVAPWCLHDVGDAGKRLLDWVFWVPRRRASDYFVDLHAKHHACELPIAPGSAVEMHFWAPGGVAIPDRSQGISAYLTRVEGPTFPKIKKKDFFHQSNAEDLDMDRDDTTSKNPCNLVA